MTSNDATHAGIRESRRVEAQSDQAVPTHDHHHHSSGAPIVAKICASNTLPIGSASATLASTLSFSMDDAAQLEALAVQVTQRQNDLIRKLTEEVAQLRGKLDAQHGHNEPPVLQSDKCQEAEQHDAHLKQEYMRLRDAHAQLLTAHGKLLAQHAVLQETYAKDTAKWRIFNEWWSAKVEERQRKIDARRAAVTSAPDVGKIASSSSHDKQHLSPHERAICESVGLQLGERGKKKSTSSRGSKRAAPPETPTTAGPSKRPRRAAADTTGKTSSSSSVLQERVNVQSPLEAPLFDAAHAEQDLTTDEADISGVKHSGSPTHPLWLTSSKSSTNLSKESEPVLPAAQPKKADGVSKHQPDDEQHIASPAAASTMMPPPKTPGPLTQDRMDLESRVEALRTARSNRKLQEAVSPSKSIASPTKPAAAVKPKQPSTPAVKDTAGPVRSRKISEKAAPTSAAKTALQSLLKPASKAEGSDAADRSEEPAIEERKRRRRERNRLAAAELAKDPLKYKGHGRYAREVEGAANKTINSEYEIDPERNGGVAFPHKDVVRNKAERKQMHAYDCPCCSEWYAAVGYPDEKNVQAHKQATSRHRAYGPPASTPPHYWQIAFPESPEAREINRKAEIEHAKRRQQMNADPRYKKRVEASPR